jgi:tetratricopeptide (TPR) repeat protein
MNKGNVLADLKKLDQALVEYDKAIAIGEILVNEEQQMHLAIGLAVAYLNKAVTLKEQAAFEEALVFYAKSISMRELCIGELNMYWTVPDLLQVLRYRLSTLFALERWATAATELKDFLSRFKAYLKDDSIDASLKESAQEEFTELSTRLRGLPPKQLKNLYAELGADAAEVRSMVEDNDDQVAQ